jgi:putative transposase
LPRIARIKNNQSISYIIVKGISDVPLFRDEDDKIDYLNLLLKYKKINDFKLYAYCIMQDYAHFILDLRGADISSIMSSVNIIYSGKYNRKYNRHGHLFYDRFKSKIIKDDLELKAMTLYIHNSPTEINKYKIHPEDYEYSSLGAYLGGSDPAEILDAPFISKFIGETQAARNEYLRLVLLYDNKKLLEEIEFYSKTSNSKYYPKETHPQINPEEILNFMSLHTGMSKLRISSRYVKSSKDVRALTAFAMKNICHFKTSDICDVLGNVCPTNVSKLFNHGLSLVEENIEYEHLMNELKKEYLI